MAATSAVGGATATDITTELGTVAATDTATAKPLAVLLLLLLPLTF